MGCTSVCMKKLVQNLAAFTGEKSVMVPRHFVSTDWTQFLEVFIIRVIHHFKLRHWEKER